jgi:hypothetical protein
VLYVLLVIMPTCRCSATCIVVFITPDGIIVGADGKVGKTVGADGKVGENPLPEQKAFLIDHRFIVACYGLASQEVPLKTGELKKFEFCKDMVETVKRRVTPDVSVSGVESIVENQATAMRLFFVRMVELGNINHQDFASGVISGYLIAGYENGIPLVYAVQVQVDWETKTVSIVDGIQQTPSPIAGGFSFQAYADHKAIEQVLGRNGEAYAYAISKFPTVIPLVVNRRPVTLEQAKTAVEDMIEVEAKFKPYAVGPPITVLVIPDSKTLPKPKTRENKQQH